MTSVDDIQLWTIADYQALLAAKQELLSGKRKTTVSLSSGVGTRSVTFQQSGMADLNRAITEAKEYLRTQEGNKRKRITSLTTRRGY